MLSSLMHRSIPMLSRMASVILFMLAISGCSGSRTSSYAPDVAPRATSQNVTIQVQQVTRYEGGIEVRLAIENRSENTIKFSRMYSNFRTVHAITDQGQVAGSRLEHGRRNFGSPYAVAAGETNHLTLQFNRNDLDSQSPLALRATASAGASTLTWDLQIPANQPQKL